jgi:type IV pilus assembly protein PilZ
MSNIIKVNIQSRQDLLKMYIQQFKFGGVFVGGNYSYQLGEEVFLIITLPEGGENIAVTGKVNWISPNSAVGYPPGIGVHFNQDKAGSDARSKIEIMLGGSLQNQANSYTF